MFKAKTAVFVGKDRSPAYRDYLIDEGFFFLFEAEEGMAKTEGREFMSHVKKMKQERGQITSLNDLETWLNEVITKDLPAHFSIAAGSVADDIVYLKTV